jgi:hypothetical protein
VQKEYRQQQEYLKRFENEKWGFATKRVKKMERGLSNKTMILLTTL